MRPSKDSGVDVAERTELLVAAAEGAALLGAVPGAGDLEWRVVNRVLNQQLRPGAGPILADRS